MPRRKSYDRDEAVEKACGAFWEHGYQALGVRELERVSGINRFALQTDFSGKEGLFLECLDHYFAESERWVMSPLRQGSLEAIKAMLEGLVTPAEGSLRCFGCLMVNTTVENATVGAAAIEAKTRRHFSSLRDAAAEAIERGQAQGEIREDLNVADGAAFVEGSVVAVNFLNRQAGDVCGGRSYVHMALSMLRSWRVAAPAGSSDG